ncbi:MAG TPA: hypothetical protein VIM37_02010 [Candidatus Microsaccharimonas sp.]|jgi:hypothetical protein
MVAKKTVTKKPVKKVARKHATASKSAPMKSFKIYKDVKPFTTVRVTRQTLYWIILLAFIAVTQLWILKIQMDIANVTTLLLNQ